MSSSRWDYWYVDNAQITGTAAGPPQIAISDAVVTEGGKVETLLETGGGLPLHSLVLHTDGKLYISNSETDSILRYDPATEVVDVFVSSGSGGLDDPQGLVFGGDGHLYVNSGNTDEVLRFDGSDGSFLGAFVTGGSGGLDAPRRLVFSGGDLYVSSWRTHQVLRYDGATGDFDGVFVGDDPGTTSMDESGGLYKPKGLLFGSDGSLYVASDFTDNVLRYDGTTGAFLGEFVTAGSGGLSRPSGIRFGQTGICTSPACATSRSCDFTALLARRSTHWSGPAAELRRPRFQTPAISSSIPWGTSSSLAVTVWFELGKERQSVSHHPVAKS